ncbi:MAG: hypothetical protein MZU91_03265 [Desulfosudis oleivorans]|nr:hypothetical protein [Desulfosudis oleivorans]
MAYDFSRLTDPRHPQRTLRRGYRTQTGSIGYHLGNDPDYVPSMQGTASRSKTGSERPRTRT